MDQQSHNQDSFRLDEEKQAIVVAYLPLVKLIAQRMHHRVLSHVDTEDLENAGVLGLIDAVSRYDETQNNLFKTYAEHRIRGAILDDFRKNDWMTRTGREKHKLLAATILDLEKALKRKVTSEEIAQSLGMEMAEYFAFLNDAKAGVFVTIEDVLQRNEMGDKNDTVSLSQAEENIWMDQVKKMMGEEVDRLEREERLVLSLYYDDELTLKEIGQIMALTESRLCQIHHEVIKKLARRLRNRIAGRL